MRNKDIVSHFYSEYFRSPRLSEFIACGGNVKAIPRDKHNHHEYHKWLNEMGYPEPTKSETYEVIRLNDNAVIFTGTPADIAEEYDRHRTTVVRACRYNFIFKKNFKIRMKKFDVNKIKG